MPKISVLLGEGRGEVPFEPGPSLRDILNTSEWRIRSACRGLGACGLCRVRVEQGKVARPTPVEQLHLEGGPLEEGVRLACQIHPQADLDITLLNPAPPSVWRTLPDSDYRSRFAPRHRSPGERRYGAAVDLGTTHISVALCDLPSGRRLAMRFGPNPQREYSADILSRLVAADESSEHAQRLQQSVVAAIGEALMDLSVREGLSLYEIARVEVVGNTAMLALLAQQNYRRLLDPDTWMAPLRCQPAPDHGWQELWNLRPDTHIGLVQPLAGFVGSDLLVGLLHAPILHQREPALFIDFGTNSEIALWDGKRFLATSAAGGPAFEGAGIHCGMAAEPGAIFRIQETPTPPWDCPVIGGVTAAGICGSGLVDLVAILLRRGALSPTGHLAGDHRGRFHLHGAPFWITKQDVDLLQRAKAAIGAGVRWLCDHASLRPTDLGAVYLGGAFGGYLDPHNAIAIGLLPPVTPERVRMLGNTALKGCQDLLVSDQAAAELTEIRARAQVINLSTVPDFQELFLEHLYLRPAAEPPA